ncbi:MAG: glycosyltransferase [Thermoguttaceae bacterium]|jgi:glycosyltransferase involved in cell wall biosynthesis
MNIGIVTQWFASGAGYVSRSYLEVLRQGHNIFIYARGGKVMRGDPIWDHPNVTWAPYHHCSTGVHAGHFIQWVKRKGIEALIYNEQRHWAGAVLSRDLGILSGAYVDYYTQNTVSFFDLFDFLICNTRRHYGVFRDHPQCIYVPWGTQTDVYKPQTPRAKRPLTFLINAGWCGSQSKGAAWMDRRGAGPAMRAFRSVTGDCRLAVLSQVPLKDCAEDWQEAVAADGRIEFRVGTFHPVPYWDGDVYVYPSRLDGIGLTLAEALSTGLPAIATDSPPMSEFVRDGENGTLVRVKEYRARPDGYFWPESICDAQSLTAALQHYVDHPELAAVQSVAARAIAERELCWKRNAEVLLKWIPEQKILCDRPGVDLQALAHKAARYDSRHNPTPTQHTIASAKIMVRHWIHRLTGH